MSDDERRSVRLRTLAAARVESDEAILKATSEIEVYAGLCRMIVRHAGLPLVWVGLVEPGTHAISVQAGAGDEVSLLDATGMRGARIPLVGGTISKALGTARPQAEDDTGPKPGETAARTLARTRGVRSYAALPIRTGHVVVGVLQCLSRESGYFGTQELLLLEQLTTAASVRLVALESEHRRRHAERQLTVSEQRYRGLFETAPVAIMVVGPGHLEVNRTLLEMFGYADQTALEAAGILSIIDPSDHHAIEQIRASLQPGESAPKILQAVGRRADGSTFPMLVEGVETDVDGVRSGLVFLTDLTSLDNAETASRQSRAQLKALVDGSPLAIVSVDLDGIVRSWNVAAEQIFGWTGAELIGRRRAPLPLQVARLRDLGMGTVPPLRGREVTHRRRDGTAVDLRISTAPLHDRGGRPSGSMLVMEDITDLNRLEAERARLVTAIDQASESIVITDPDAAIVYVNPAFEKLTGHRREEVLGKNPRILQSGVQNAAFYTAMWATLARGETWRGSLVNRRKDGALFEEEATI